MNTSLLPSPAQNTLRGARLAQPSVQTLPMGPKGAYTQTPVEYFDPSGAPVSVDRMNVLEKQKEFAEQQAQKARMDHGFAQSAEQQRTFGVEQAQLFGQEADQRTAINQEQNRAYDQLTRDFVTQGTEIQANQRKNVLSEELTKRLGVENNEVLARQVMLEEFSRALPKESEKKRAEDQKFEELQAFFNNVQRPASKEIGDQQMFTSLPPARLAPLSNVEQPILASPSRKLSPLSSRPLPAVTPSLGRQGVFSVDSNLAQQLKAQEAALRAREAEAAVDNTIADNVQIQELTTAQKAFRQEALQQERKE